MKPRFYWIAAVIAALVVVPVEAANLLFVSDTTTDLDIPTALESDGHTVTVVTDDHASGNAALKGDLSSFSAVYWSTSQVVHDRYHVSHCDVLAWGTAECEIVIRGTD
jgi:hypothetical protein